MKVNVRLPARSFPWAPPTVPRTVEPLPEESKVGGNYDSAWARKTPARYARFFVRERYQ